MAGKLLDTNAVIAFFVEDAMLVQFITDVAEVFVPSIALGELYYGVYKSLKVEANLARLNKFIAARTVLSCDALTAEHYGRIRQQLRTTAFVRLLLTHFLIERTFMAGRSMWDRFNQVDSCCKGRPIPDNDIWIAALADQHQLILVSRDQHFNEVDGLQIEKW